MQVLVCLLGRRENGDHLFRFEDASPTQENRLYNQSTCPQKTYKDYCLASQNDKYPKRLCIILSLDEFVIGICDLNGGKSKHGNHAHDVVM